MKPRHILIVDSERDAGESLADCLRRNGYRISIAGSAGAARDALQNHAIDLVILDIMMPGEEGLALFRYLRAISGLPVILLTASDHLTRSELGTNDYMVKPCNPRELLTRVKAVLLRPRPPLPRIPAVGRIRFDHLILDIEQRHLLDRNRVVVPLSTGEFLLLHALLTHAQRILSREQLLDLTQGPGNRLFGCSIDNQISRLRKKIESDHRNPRLIKDAHGGYMCAVAVEIL